MAKALRAEMTDQGRAFFHENGYYILREAFGKDELAVLRERARIIQERVRKAPIKGTRFFGVPDSVTNDVQKGPYTWGVNEITRPELFDAVLINALGSEKIDAVLTAVIEEPRAWGLKILWAPQVVDYDLIWHRDVADKLEPVIPYKDPRNDHVQFNAALEYDDSFIVIPKSHRRPLTPDELSMRRQNTATLPGQLRVELDPGDVVFMDAHAFHRGQAKAGAPRLSLHFSVQAQWVPLKPWGEPEHFAWITSDDFIGQLAPRLQPYYERLKTAETVDDAMGWLVQRARDAGWSGELV
jgi:hypothetical protein